MIFSKKMFNRNDCIAVLLHCVAAQIDIKKEKKVDWHACGARADTAVWIGIGLAAASWRLAGSRTEDLAEANRKQGI